MEEVQLTLKQENLLLSNLHFFRAIYLRKLKPTTYKWFSTLYSYLL